MAKRKLEMDIINPNAAGIDIGGRSHFVSINQYHSDVREFGAARKLATILWNMLYKKQQYCTPTIYECLDQKRKSKVLELQKQIANLDDRMNKIQPA